MQKTCISCRLLSTLVFIVIQISFNYKIYCFYDRIRIFVCPYLPLIGSNKIDFFPNLETIYHISVIINSKDSLLIISSEKIIHHICYRRFYLLWWIDLGWIPDTHQSHSITLLCSLARERKYNEGFMVWCKDRGRLLTKYSSWSKQTWIGNINWIYY